MDEAVVIAELEHAVGENPAAPDSERRSENPYGEDMLREDALDNEKSHTYYFESSTITVGKIKEME
jgi:hypothetical protein